MQLPFSLERAWVDTAEGEADAIIIARYLRDEIQGGRAAPHAHIDGQGDLSRHRPLAAGL